MQVKVYATLRPIIGGAVAPVETVPGQTVRELVDEMVARWPNLRPEMVDEQGKLLQRIQIFVNGRSIAFGDGLATVIPVNANIAIFPPVGGGC
ncbi:MAG TPA: ubiquitin-like small modifier protein 1 [Anaerolineae bacterium]|nr:ubiquitin-like small modifier protein 1 [Anaerolineae bacterium]